MSALLNDIKYAFRQLLKNPGFANIALLTLALGLGINTSVFSVINTVLLRPLPLTEPDRLVRLSAVRERAKFLASSIVSYPDFLDWREQSRSFMDLAAYDMETRDIIAAGLPEYLSGLTVSHGFFEMLGVRAALGRTFVEGEDQPGTAGVIVLSHKMWQRHFASDPDILGQAIQLDEASYTIVGVLDADFPGHLFDNPAFFTPLRERRARNRASYKVIGRIHAHVTMFQVQERLSAALARLQEEQQGAIADARITGLCQYVVGSIRLYLLSLLGATCFVLLIACVNLANLVLTRMTTRQKEIAMRRALGAGLFRIARQMLTENLLLTLIGGGIGLLLAYWTNDLLRLHLGGFVPRASEISVDGCVMCFALVMALGTGILVAVVPVLRLRGYGPLSLLGDRFRSGRGGNRLSDALVVFEIGAALILLMGAGLMIRTFYNLMVAHPGYEADHVVSFRVRLPESRYAASGQRQAFYERALQRLGALPCVERVAISNMIPYGRMGMYTNVFLPGRAAEEGGEVTGIGCHIITSDYLSALEIPLFSGRSFQQQDFAGEARSALINRQLAQACWPGENPLGRHIRVGWMNETYEIIGVVGNTFQEDPTEAVELKVYLPFGKMTESRCGLYGFVVRTPGDPAGMLASIRAAMLEVDPALPIQRLAPMRVQMAESIRQERFTLISLGLFAGVALILVLIGIYGVVSYVVSRRTNELGIRMALGAPYRQIMGMILKRGMVLATAGSTVGLVGALGLTRFLSSYLYGITAVDPVTLISVVVLITVVTLLACIIPAQRAARIDPMEALRYE